jgi:hypothetical protein
MFIIKKAKTRMNGSEQKQKQKAKMLTIKKAKARIDAINSI